MDYLLGSRIFYNQKLPMEIFSAGDCPLGKIPGSNPCGSVRVRTAPCVSDSVRSSVTASFQIYALRRNVAKFCGSYVRGGIFFWG